jgi:hypothetical protein
MTIRELYELALRTGNLDATLTFPLDDGTVCEVREVRFEDGEALLDE